MFSNIDNKNKTVLLIDDDKITHILLNEVLSEKINVLCAECGAKGIDILRFYTDEIDLIFLDLFLPNESGFGVLHEIKTLNSKIPVIAVTAAPISEVTKQCIDTGFDEILTKPLDIYELQNAVNKYLN